MKKHGNEKYKFSRLVNIGDTITEYPNNIYSLKSAFRAFNVKREKSGLPQIIPIYNEYGGKRVDIEVRGFKELPTTNN